MDDGPQPLPRFHRSTFATSALRRRRPGRVVHRVRLLGAGVWVASLFCAIGFALGAAPGPATDPAQAAHAAWTWELLTVGSLLINVFLGISTLINHRAAKKASGELQRREVTFGAQYVTAEQSELLHNGINVRVSRLEVAVNEIRDEMRSARDADREAEEERTVRIHDRIESIEQRLAEMPQKIVTLLLNTQLLAQGKRHE